MSTYDLMFLIDHRVRLGALLRRVKWSHVIPDLTLLQISMNKNVHIVKTPTRKCSLDVSQGNLSMAVVRYIILSIS